MKKLIAIGGIIVVIFALIFVLNKQSNKDKLENNPYDTDNLNQATIDLIDDENYSNIILPADLKTKIEAGESVTAYFFSPLCEYCKQMTPIMMPIAKDMDIKVEQLNLLEYENVGHTYQIEATPTLIHFENGEEVGRMVDGQPEENIRSFFEAIKGEK